MTTTTLAALRPGSRNKDATPEPARFIETEKPSKVELFRRCRAMKQQIEAAGFVLFTVAVSREGSSLVPVFHTESPELALAAKLLSTRPGDTFARHAASSSAPLWWSADPHSVSAASFRTLAWAGETEPCVPETEGLCLPVQSEDRQQGLFLFLGSSIRLDEKSLCDLHARCFVIFGEMARMQSPEGNSTPVVSKRELECLRLTADGYTSEDIAAHLGLSVHTANQHLTNVTQKLNAANRVHAAAKALRLRLID